MKRTGRAAFSALAMSVLFAGWALLAWNTGVGGEIFIEPGRVIAESILPAADSSQPFKTTSAKSVDEAFVHVAVARGLEHGLQAWWCALAFWVVILPALIFGAVFMVRRP
jgi:hypothetical protein